MWETNKNVVKVVYNWDSVMVDPWDSVMDGTWGSVNAMSWDTVMSDYWDYVMPDYWGYVMSDSISGFWGLRMDAMVTALPDIAGITNTNRLGETSLGVDFFTGAELAPIGEVISRRFICDRCGYPTPKAELIKQAGWMVCKRCIDD